MPGFEEAAEEGFTTVELERKRAKAAHRACKEICDWLDGENLWPSHGENIVDEARRQLATAGRNGTLPKGCGTVQYVNQ